MRIISQIGDWFRSALAARSSDSRSSGTPGTAKTRQAGFNVFGSAALTVFLLQLVTGILLALIYVSLCQ